MPDSYREVSEQALAELFDYWAARCRGRRMPSRRDIDPLEIPRKHLPDLMLIDVLHDPVRFHYRLVGTRVVAASGENRTGRFFHEVPFFRAHSLVLEQFRQVAVTGRPLYSLEPFRNYIENTTYQVDRLLLPLSSDGDRVDMLMVGFHFKTGPYAGA
jgi:hypothetical protein